LLKRSITLEIEKTYSKLKTILIERGSKIISEAPPGHISIQHGSLRGVYPKSAKKMVNFNMFQNKMITKIESDSKLSPDWIILTLVGNIIAGFVAAAFWWIATDIADLVVNGNSGYWTWLAEIFGYPNVQYTLFMSNVLKTLSIVLVVTIILEILDFFIVYRKIDAFAKEILHELADKKLRQVESH
jgi:hypothetical protein